MSSLVIDLNSLGDSGTSLEFTLDSKWLKESMASVDSVTPTDGDEGSVTVRVQPSGDDILVQGEVRATLQLTCVRSLQLFPHTVHTPITVLFSPRGSPRAPAADEGDLPGVGPGRDVYSGHQLILDELVREHIILELPMNPTCVGPDGGLQVPDHMVVGAFSQDSANKAQERDLGDHAAVSEVADSTGSGAVDPRLAPLQELARTMGKKKE